MKTVAVLLFICIVAWAAGAAENSGHVQVNADRILKQSAIPVYNYKIMETYPHDTTSYTEGLVVENGIVYEGTGLYGQSKLRKWDLRSGHILKEANLNPNYFGEGITFVWWCDLPTNIH